MVTIYDIARATGYSAPTVSKALNGQSDIAGKTREKIEHVAKAMGYVPNLHAKTLVTKKSWLIGVIYQERDVGQGIEHPLFAGILNAFKDQVEMAGYELIFITRKLGPRIITYLEHCRYRTVDGVLILNIDSAPDEVDEIIRAGIPCVSANPILPNTINVVSENIDSSIEAVKYLYSLGHRQIAHISGPRPDASDAGAERMSGYIKGMRMCQLDVRKEHIVTANHWNADSGFEAMMTLLRDHIRPSAVYCASDLITFGVLRACKESRIRVPEDISLISFDDTSAASFISPPLTTMRQDRSAIGSMAADLLIQRIRGEIGASLIHRIPVTLIERKSCRRYT